MNEKLDRRSFVGFAALGLGAVASGVPLRWFDGRVLRGVELGESKRALFVRAEIHSAAGQAMVPSLRAGVAAMRARSAANANDQTGWNYQWKMHGTYDFTTKLAWKTCQHGNFFFVTWHRMYLYYFERIMRKASGDPNFALPYWNYEPLTQLQLPLAFRENPTTNALYFSERGDGINDGSAGIVATNGDPAWALAASQFNGAQPAGFGGGVVPSPVHFGDDDGRLERLPHNFVHGDLGGDMGDPNTAANDPIFWLHHANIDRLWSYWKALDSANHKDPTTNTVWMNTLFTFFDENGAAVQMKGGDVLDSAGQLGYRYDTEFMLSPEQLRALRDMLRRRPFPFQFEFRFFRRPIPWPPKPPEPPVPWRSTIAATNKRITINAVDTVTTLPISRESIAGFRTALAQPSQTTRLHLALEGLSVRRPPGGRIDVFVLGGKQSLPSAMKVASERPARFYAGTLDFFSIFGQFGTADGVRNAVLAVDVSDVLRAQLSTLSDSGDTLTVLFQFRGTKRTKDKTLIPPSHPITIEGIRVYVGGATR